MSDTDTGLHPHPPHSSPPIIRRPACKLVTLRSVAFMLAAAALSALTFRNFGWPGELSSVLLGGTARKSTLDDIDSDLWDDDIIFHRDQLTSELDYIVDVDDLPGVHDFEGDLNTDDDDGDDADDDGETHSPAPSWKACYDGDIGGIRQGLQRTCINGRLYKTNLWHRTCACGWSRYPRWEGTCLHHAVSRGRFDYDTREDLPTLQPMPGPKNTRLAVQYLLRQGADVNAVTKPEGETALIIAASLGHVGLVRLLLDAGASTTVRRRNDGFQAIHAAAEAGHDLVVQLLLPYDHGTKNDDVAFVDDAAADDDGVDEYDVDEYDFDDLEDEEDEEADWFQWVVDEDNNGEGPTPHNASNVDGAAFNASSSSDSRLVNFSHLANLSTRISSLRVRPLLSLRTRIARLEASLSPLSSISLLDYCSPVRASGLSHRYPRTSTENHVTPLHLAAQRGHLDLVKSLVDSHKTNGNTASELNARTADGQTALHLAAARGHPDIVQVLLDNGLSPTSADEQGLTPLHVAASNDRSSALRLMLAVADTVDPVRAASGATPLLAALENFASEAAVVLIAHGANMTAKLTSGETVLHQAVRIRDTELVQMALDSGVGVDEQNEDGDTALHFVASRLFVLRSWSPTTALDILMRHGADMGVVNNDGMTPFQVALQRYAEPALIRHWVTHYNVTVSRRDLSAAIKSGCCACLDVLLDQHHVVEGSVATELLWEAVESDGDVSSCVHPLLEVGADPHAPRHSDNKTMLQVAAAAGLELLPDLTPKMVH